MSASVKKDKTVAALLAIFLGDFGIHKFYLGQTGRGILYLVFCWTMIPGFIGFVEGIIYLAQTPESWNAKYNSAYFDKGAPDLHTQSVSTTHPIDVLQSLNQIRQSGGITEEEYQEQKAEILRQMGKPS